MLSAVISGHIGKGKISKLVIESDSIQPRTAEMPMKIL